MSQKNVLVGRARFDNEDAKGVVIFLQEGDGQGFASAHRGWSRYELAQLVSTKKTIKMILTEDLTGDKKQTTLEKLTAYSEKLNRLKNEVEVEPSIYFIGGFAVNAEFQWERDVTELEVVAAKAYLRDYADQPVKKKSAYTATFSSSNSLRSIGDRLAGVLEAAGTPATETNEWNWDDSVAAVARATTPQPAAPQSTPDYTSYSGREAQWLVYDETTTAPDPFGQPEPEEIAVEGEGVL